VRPLGDDSDGVVGGTGGSVGAQQAGQLFQVNRDFGNQGSIGIGKIAGHPGRHAAVAPEKLDDQKPFVTSYRGAQPVDQFDRP